MITIRKLTTDDLDELWKLRLLALKTSADSFGMTFDEGIARGKDSIRSNLSSDNKRFSYLGAFDSSLVGMLGISRQGGTKDEHKADIVSMFVALDHRGKGVGTSLMKAAVDFARKVNGVEQLGLTVVTTNAAARRLFKSIGFVAWGVEPLALKSGDQYWDEEHMFIRL